MKILTAEQNRLLDKYIIEGEPVASIDLMERAASRFAESVASQMDTGQPVFVFCGMGNNGGDGLAIARLLTAKGFKNVLTYVVKHAEKGSEDFYINEERLRSVANINYITTESEVPVIGPGAVCIDALFGSGLSRGLEGLAATVVNAINKAAVTVYSVDVPSGLFCDKLNGAADAVIQSTITWSFHAPKFSFLLPQNAKYVPEFRIIDIGATNVYTDNISTLYEYIDDKLIRGIFRKREKFSHKGTYGHALICAGSYGKIGAAVMAVGAALRAGAGLVSAQIPACGYRVIQNANPGAMVMADAAEKSLTEIKDYSKYAAIGVGPGIGAEPRTFEFFDKFLRTITVPLVIDADALNILASYPHLRNLVPKNSIVTPHPGEFKRLAGEWANDVQKIERQIQFSKQYNVVVVLKGAHTSVSTPEGKVYFNSTGNPGMAKGGSGDVLTGVITSLLAQGYTATHAAVIGAYIHGLAGDLAAANLGQTGMQATDIINYLPPAFKVFE
ncbi:MAG TPA: NAD(P)H-hydrate dehydratase [Chitinophagales bacterium]|nr:NAD(P)H-hydrate dehydratase [Chitinophagales bacterium]